MAGYIGSRAVALSTTTANIAGNITVDGTVDGRDVSTDGTKLDAIESGATADQTAAEIKTAYESNSDTNAYTDAEQTKLAGIETGADVTDTTNVTAAGALMDNEVTNLAQVKAFNSADYATAAQGTTADNALPKAGGTMTGALTLSGAPTTNLHAATKAYVDGEVAGIVDAAPATLDTLNELAAALGDDPNFATTTATNIGTKVAKSGDTMTGNLSFGDNDKAIFGASNPLEIYHDGSNKYIQDTGSGSLFIRGSDLVLEDEGGNDYITMSDTGTGGTVTLKHNASAKLATTSTGVDITGTLTSDALNVSAASPNIDVTDTGTSHASQDFLTNSNTVRATIGVERSSGGGLFVGSSPYAAVFGTASSGNTQFATNNNVRMTLDGSGNVGIGTSSPDVKLHVSDGHLRVAGTETSGSFLNMSASNTGSDGVTILASYYGSGSYGPIKFTTGGSERARLDASGNLLVGTTSASTTTVGARLKTSGRGDFTANGGATSIMNRLTNDGDMLIFQKDGTTVGSIGSASDYLYIYSPKATGGAGIGFGNSWIYPCNSTGSALDATFDLGISNARYKDAHFSGTVNAANFNTSSDATLKTNVETLTGSLDAVKAMRGVSFDWIENGNSEVGVIAQEVEEVIPDVVSTNDQGIKSVKYGNLVGVLIEAIKEQQQRIEALEAKLNS